MDSLVAIAIHDAKNALGSLGVWLAQARKEYAVQTAGGESTSLRQAEAIAEQLNRQLVELLVFYRAGEGHLRLTVADQRLDDFLDDVMAEFSAASRLDETAHITIETRFSATAVVDDWAFDAYLVKFVLLDALRNTLRHARSRVCFSCTLEEGQGQGRALRFTIEDDGEGYPPELLAGSAADTQAAAMATVVQDSGSGLGLSFARLIATRHHAAHPQGEQQGRVSLSNAGLNQGGACFSLWLP